MRGSRGNEWGTLSSRSSIGWQLYAWQGLYTGNMDASINRIADYASTLAYGDLPAQVVHECKRRIIDTVGCALGAFDEEPSRIARALAARVEVPDGARILGAA